MAQAVQRPGVLGSKYFLYATEFFAGMSVMAIELGASRLLAPYFSSSQIVWTIIIGTIMIAMAIGNVWGGRLADRDADPDRLYRRLLLAAVWTAAIPFAGKYIIIGISALLALVVEKHFLIWAAFAACFLIFVFPLLLLGTVTPSLAKYVTDNLEDNGKNIGNLGALNTIGSIIGTFVPTFITIPAVGTAVTFLIFAGILLVICLAYFASVRRQGKRCLAAVVLMALCAAGGAGSRFAFWEKDLLYEGESIYNYLQVRETPESVILSTNVLFGVQSVHMKEAGLTGMYYDYALAAPLLAGITEAEEASVLILGLGSGTYASQCSRYFPQAQVTGVEIDEQIVQLAHDYFELPSSVETAVYDGRAYLAASRERYDVIMVDAYQDITIPFQMSTVEFFDQVRDHLTEKGVMVVNMNMHSDSEGAINQYLADTISTMFPSVYTAEVPGTTNRVLFAAAEGDLAGRLRQALPEVKDEALAGLMAQAAERLTPYQSSGRLLTDDRAPVELLGMRAIDELIAGELTYYRGILEREGVSGLIQAM